MGELNSSELTSFFMGLAVLLGSAHVLGEVARRLGQPVVIGEMVAGLILGPSLLGWLAPDFQQWLFPHQGPAATAIDAVVILGVALLLLVAGMEVDLSTVWRQGTTALSVGLGGALIPLAVGGAVAWLAPEWWGMPPSGSPGPFAVFFGVAMAVSALPVIAKILLDLDLLKTDFGMLTLVAATLTNLVAWLVFSVLLRAGEEGHSIAYTVALTLGFVALVLTVGRWLADRLLPWVQAHLVKRLKRPDAADLFVGREQDPVDVRGAQEDLRAARKDLDDLAAEFGAGEIDMQEWRVARASARARKEKAEAVLATAVQVNPVVGLLGAEDVEAAWDGLDLSRQRAVIDWAMTVRVLPAKSGRRPGGTYWDRDAVEIVWK